MTGSTYAQCITPITKTMTKAIKKIIRPKKKAPAQVPEIKTEVIFPHVAPNGAKNVVYRLTQEELKATIQAACNVTAKETASQVEKAFGGCKLCYGKGYSTQALTIPHTNQPAFIFVRHCACPRGIELKKIMDCHPPQHH